MSCNSIDSCVHSLLLIDQSLSMVIVHDLSRSGRCCMQGGNKWARAARFNDLLYGIDSMESSADKIADTISQQPAEHAVVVMAHNGPSGVGAAAHDICGKDWSDKAGASHHT